MMRLPQFRYHAPRTLREAAAILRKEGPQAMIVASHDREFLRRTTTSTLRLRQQ